MFLRYRKTVFGLLLFVASLFATQVTAQGVTPWSMGGWPLNNTWSSIPGYATMPYSYPSMNRYLGYLRSGGNPISGYSANSPQSFRYQRPGFAGGPYGYVQGWVSPRGDFEGTLVIRGNMRKLMGDYRNQLYNYYYSQ